MPDPILAREPSNTGYACIYVERDVLDHPRTQNWIDRNPRAQVIEIDRYGEVFNPRKQSFRRQKRRSALIVARKQGNLLLDTPEGYGIGEASNFYFSHLLNCPYDCRYCFLQGMFASAHHVAFVNFEEFWQAIEDRQRNRGDRPAWYFSGYDCDSLALDSVSGFVDFFVPRFAARPGAHLELRTKSANVASLLRLTPSPRVVTAFSLSPAPVVTALEHRTAPVESRIAAAARLAAAGWPIGFRFDPLIYHRNWREHYAELVRTAIAAVELERLHSISIGPLRFPKPMYQTISRMYPDEPLFAGPLGPRSGMVSYPRDIESEMNRAVRDQIAELAPDVPLFSCTPDGFSDACGDVIP